MVVQDLLKHATRNGLIPESNAACSISVRMYDRVLLGNPMIQGWSRTLRFITTTYPYYQ